MIPSIAVAASLALQTQAGFVPPRGENQPFLVNQLFQCRNLGSDAEQLDCFRRATDAIEAAQNSQNLVMLDRTQVQAARRDLFGFSMPSLPKLFGDSVEGESLSSIETTLVNARQTPDGKWVFNLEDQSEWRQIDSMPVRFTNRSGAEVRVRSASLGSYLMTIGKSRAVRVRRQ